MQSIPITIQLGELIKSFRIRNEKTAKDISTAIGKTPSYLSKIESGSTKKMASCIFTELCNAISESAEGIKAFITFAFQNNPDYDKDTSLILLNIDDILYKFIPPHELIEYINKELASGNITIDDLIAELNANNDLSNLSETVYDSLPYNIYTFVDDERNSSVIKLLYDYDTIYGILKNSAKTNYVTLEAMLYSLNKLCGQPSDDARINAIRILNDRFKIISTRKVRTIVITSKEDEEKYLGRLEPEVENHFHHVAKGIRFALLLSQSKGGADRINTLDQNLTSDLGFTFSFISTDLEKLFPLSNELKRNFLKDLNKLIEEYSTKKDTNTNFFFDE